MTEEKKNPQVAGTQTAPQQPTEPVELTIQDLGVIRSIIDVASQRGAFKANEMEAVGKTYNKLENFLETVQKKSEEAKAAQEKAQGEKANG
tara:strand:+ start:5915 stop:6187 length:273 start_codon:yes stop_codon:yes gene_type:complete